MLEELFMLEKRDFDFETIDITLLVTFERFFSFYKVNDALINDVHNSSFSILSLVRMIDCFLFKKSL